VQQRVDALYQEAEIATEHANTVDLEVRDARRHLTSLRADIAKQERAYEALHAVIARAASDMYATGGIDPSMQMMVSSNPEDFLLQAQSLDQVMRTQDAELRRAETAQLALQQTKTRADQELSRLRGLQADAQKERDTANAKLADAQQLLSRLKAEQRQRLAALQAQRAREAAAAARTAPTPPSNPSPSPSASAPQPTSSSASGRGSSAVAYALAQLGKPYVFGAAGPSAFDCSGLTMAAWATAGVSLPHAVSGQYAATTRVDSSALIPGDLVFFYSGLHHVGIYVGNGMFVHAANPTDGVVEDSLFSSYWQSVYQGAGRL
jgi:cell wall-associated NlpC family hydrolase